MLTFNKSFLTVIVVVFFSAHCKTAKKQPSNYWIRLSAWNETTKRIIFLQSQSPFDSSLSKIIENNSLTVETNYKKGHLAIQKTFTLSGKLISESYFSTDGLFELRIKMCNREEVESETIYFKEHAYGLSTTIDCPSARLKEVGFLFNDKKYGIWKTIDGSGTVIETDLKRHDLLDSLQKLKVTYN